MDRLATALPWHGSSTLRELVGDHVRHNAYFIGFPENVPDTMEFWVSCLRDALVQAHGAPANVGSRRLRALLRTGPVDLLRLPPYGRYRHSFTELLAAHDELVASARDRLTVLHLGEPLAQEARSLYLRLAGSTTPLGEGDLVTLGELAAECSDARGPCGRTAPWSTPPGWPPDGRCSAWTRSPTCCAPPARHRPVT